MGLWWYLTTHHVVILHVKFMELTRQISMNAFSCVSLSLYCSVWTAEGTVILLKETDSVPQRLHTLPLFGWLCRFSSVMLCMYVCNVMTLGSSVGTSLPSLAHSRPCVQGRLPCCSCSFTSRAQRHSSLDSQAVCLPAVKLQLTIHRISSDAGCLPQATLNI